MIAAAVVGIAALVLTGAGIFMAPAAFAALTATLGGVTAAMLTVAAGVLSIGASLLAPRPKAPAMGGGTLERLNMTLNPNAFRAAVFGKTAFATDIGNNEAGDVAGTEDDQEVHRWVVCAAHKVNAIQEIWFENEMVWSLSGGVIAKYASTDGAPYLEVQVRTEGSAANYINEGVRVTPSTLRYTGCAYVYFHFYLNSTSPFSSGIPQRCTIIGEGMPVYDPRKDSTVVGGSGTQRADDQTTWSYSVSGNLAGQNPALQLFTWLLGWRIGGKVSVGKGIPKDRIDWPAVITAANVCDETQTLAGGGTSKRYQAGGIVNEGDDVLAAVDRWKAAMNATMDDVDGQIRLQCLTNDLGAPIADFTEDDIIDDVSYTMSSNLTADYNIIRGAFVNPATNVLYQLAEYPDIVLTSRDGIDRIETVNYDMVQSQSQAQRLSKQRLQRAQYAGIFQATFKITAWKVQKGDVVRLTFGPFGQNLKLYRVIDLKHSWNGYVPLTLREENAQIYAWDNEDAPVVVYAAATNYSNADTPWQRMMKGQWLIPNVGGDDANLLKDVTFGSKWLKTSLQFKREFAGLVTATWPFAAELAFVGQVVLGSGASRTATNRESLRITGSRLYYFRVQIAKSVGANAGSVVVTLSCVFKTASGGTVAGGLNQTVNLNTIAADGQYYEKIFSVLAPATAAKIESFAISVGGNAATGTVRFCKPWISDKEPGADISAVIAGQSTDTIKYDYTGALDPTDQLPRDYGFNLTTPGGNVTSGSVWSYKVYSGTVNGFTSASGVKSMTGTGSGLFTLTSLGTDTADVDIFVTNNGKSIGPFRLHLAKEFGDPPVSGGGGGSSSEQTSGFNAITNTTFNAISMALLYTMPAGKTAAILSANISARPAAGGGAGSWTCQGKWQKESAVGSGTWADVTASVVSADSSVVQEGGSGGEPIFYIRNPAALDLSVSSTGLTPGVEYSFRFVGRVSVGGTRSHACTGNVSVTS